MRRIRKRIRRREAGAFFEPALDWAFLATLILVIFLWRLVRFFADDTLSCGQSQRFWMYGYAWDTSLMEMFGWALLLLVVAWIGWWLVPRKRPQLFQRTIETLLMVYLGMSWGLFWSGYFPNSAEGRLIRHSLETVSTIPIIGPFSGYYSDFTPVMERWYPTFPGADGERHPFEIVSEAPLASTDPMASFGTYTRQSGFFGHGCSCLNLREQWVEEEYVIRDAILETGIEPHPDLIAEWAELPPRPVEPDWCPLPGDPIGGWPDGYTRL